MSDRYVIPLDDQDATLEVVGGKGASLARMVISGLPVPGGFHVTTTAYKRFVDVNELHPRILEALERTDTSRPSTLESASNRIRELFQQADIPADIADAIKRAYCEFKGESPAVAVRSSATAEDQPDFSFAGQQETFLNVCGEEDVVEAVRNCWASLWTARAIGYRIQRGMKPNGAPSTLSMAVVVQLLVQAQAAGIMFTANPVNGRRDLAMVSAAWGLGEAIVGGLVTPDTLTMDKESRKVLVRETAEKLVMTVRVDGGTQEVGVPEELRNAPVLSDTQAADLMELGSKIEDLYQMPMDIEWVLADGEISIVQARPITALPQPEAEPPNEWVRPNPKGQYMRVSIIELMPDPLSPLYKTMGLPSICKGIKGMAEDLMDVPSEAIPDEFILTINEYAYMLGTFTGRQWWLLLTRMLPSFPRVLREAVPYWQEVVLPEYEATIDRWRQVRLSEMTPSELLTASQEIVDSFANHLATLMASTMGVTAGTEQLFTTVYDKLVRREGDPPAPTFLLGFDSLPILGEKALYDLAKWCKEREALAGYLGTHSGEEIAGRLANGQAPADVLETDWQELLLKFQAYLDHYGYAIYDLDFARPLPQDEPTPIIKTMKLFLSGKGKSPYERQQVSADRREQSTLEVRQRLRGLRRWAFEKTLKLAQRQAPLREDGISEIGRGYPVLRRMLMELGRRFHDAGAIDQSGDIFWLEVDEVAQAVADLEGDRELSVLTESVKQRKAVWKACKRVEPPPQLPPKAKYMGFDMEQFLAGGAGEAGEGSIRGLGVSPGRVTATARVMHGPEQFDEMQAGDVLVASITTPAWTPLFAMASGIVTDIGGSLSHSSIVAREYGIPAVLGTGVATHRIRSGQVVTVDGSEGLVILTEQDEAAESL